MSKELGRRQFMKRAALLGGGVALSGPIASVLAACGGGAAAPAPGAPAAPAPAAPAQAPASAAPAQAPAAAPAPAAAAPAGGLTGPVRLLSWSDKVIPGPLENFENEFGVTVELIVIQDNPEAFGKVKATGPEAYDVIGMDGLWCQEYYRNGFIEAVSWDEYESADQIFPQFQNYEKWREPGGTGKMLAFPWAGSPQLINWDKTKVTLPDPPSFEVFFDPKWKNRVALRNSAAGNFIMAASMLGFHDFEVETPEGSRWSLPDDVLKRATQELIKAKDNFKSLYGPSSELVRTIATGEVWLGYGFQSVAVRAAVAGNENIGSEMPKEPTIGWIDGHMITKGAKNREAGIKYIDLMGRAENMAEYMKLWWHSVLNVKALDLLKVQGFGEQLDFMSAYKFGEWSTTYSLFQPYREPDKIADAWAEFLAA